MVPSSKFTAALIPNMQQSFTGYQRRSLTKKAWLLPATLPPARVLWPKTWSWNLDLPSETTIWDTAFGCKTLRAHKELSGGPQKVLVPYPNKFFADLLGGRSQYVGNQSRTSQRSPGSLRKKHAAGDWVRPRPGSCILTGTNHLGIQEPHQRHISSCSKGLGPLAASPLPSQRGNRPRDFLLKALLIKVKSKRQNNTNLTNPNPLCFIKGKQTKTRNLTFFFLSDHIALQLKMAVPSLGRSKDLGPLGGRGPRLEVGQVCPFLKFLSFFGRDFGCFMCMSVVSFI